MKRFPRMIAWMTAVVLLLSVCACAFADFEDPLYVSPAFRIPENRIISDPLTLDDEDEDAEEKKEAEAGEEASADEATAETETPEGEEKPEGETVETVEGEGAEGEQTAAPENGEQTEVQEGEPEAEPEPEPEIPKKVSIYSSRKDVVTEGERIYLTSYLEGFDGLTVMYQWQVDRGNGWENVEGATRDSYSFIATKESILYSWRMIVYYDE